ncbi:hypothetical protein OF387_06475 [Lentilactobacillus hilgardii]|nr:hypothetical protein [Lentilactobacillus hilgardii]MCV3740867.1 hypothetical protein [Lentilactobacillus hilgardii]
MKKFIWGIVVVAFLGLGGFLTQPVSASAWHHGVPSVIRNKTFELNTPHAKYAMAAPAYSFTNHMIRFWAAGFANDSSDAKQIYYKPAGSQQFYLRGTFHYTKKVDGYTGSEKVSIKVKMVNSTHLYVYDKAEKELNPAPYKYAGKATIKRLPDVPKGTSDH